MRKEEQGLGERRLFRFEHDAFEVLWRCPELHTGVPTVCCTERKRKEEVLAGWKGEPSVGAGGGQLRGERKRKQNKRPTRTGKGARLQWMRTKRVPGGQHRGTRSYYPGGEMDES